MMSTPANAVPLSPISFLQRTGDVYPDVTMVSDPASATHPEWSGAEFRRAADRIAGAIRGAGVAKGERVAVLSRNNPHMLQLHFGIPGSGAVMVPLNIRLAPREYGYILDHCGARVLFVDHALLDRVEAALGDVAIEHVVVLVTDDTPSQVTLEEWVDEHDDGAGMRLPDDEHDPIAINYTSGTTGRPKGAVYTHRGAYLNAMGQALAMQLTPSDVYLWTLPMFHCDGWCHTWAVTAVGARHVCLRDFDARTTLGLLASEGVTRFCGAPVILNSLASVDAAHRPRLDRDVACATGGAPPAPATIQAMTAMGVRIVHLYGLTETYGPSLVCEPQADWADLDLEDYAERTSRQGVRTINVQQVRVVDVSMDDVADDAATMGEIVVRSNTVMAGYFDDEEATHRAFEGGWLHTGDLAVMHPDGYIEIKDRSKDIIISGGENVSSIEVENVLMSHPAVNEVAVVAADHPQWGEVPVAFVTPHDQHPATESELIAYVRERLAHFKAPRAVVFGPLPKTSTGKIQKFELRHHTPPVA